VEILIKIVAWGVMSWVIFLVVITLAHDFGFITKDSDISTNMYVYSTIFGIGLSLTFFDF
jgi:hypothetical protein